jgi:hypothetical protein
MLRKVITAVFVALATVPAGAQTLWHETLIGMTADEVKAIVRDAVPPEKPGRGTDGSEILLIVPTIDIVNKQFKASFFFKEARLRAVSLTPTAQEPTHLAMMTFNSLVTALRSRYGNELSFQREENEMFGPVRKVTWASGSSTIELYLIGIGRDSASMGVNYSTKLAASANKL